MRVPSFRLAALALASGIVLSGCAYDMYGDPYGYGYGYGPQSTVSIGVGYGGYGGYGGYYGGGYYPYGGYGYGYPYGGYDPFGWYGDFYYPGTGIYVYDRDRHRHQWTDEQRRYWEQRRQQWHDHGGTSGTGANWNGWERSHWRDRSGTASAVTTTTTTNNSNRGSWQTRSSISTGGERMHRSDGDHSSRSHSADRSDEHPN